MSGSFKQLSWIVALLHCSENNGGKQAKTKEGASRLSIHNPKYEKGDISLE